MTTMYVKLGPRTPQIPIDRSAGSLVFWFAFARWWSGLTTGKTSNEKDCGHYTQVMLDRDCLDWGPEREDLTVGWVLSGVLLDTAFRNEPMIGFYDSPAQQAPKYDPGLGAPCPLCYIPLSKDDLRTVSVMPHKTVDGDKFPTTRSYFYRLHRTCAKKATQAQHQALDEYAMSWIPPGLAN